PTRASAVSICKWESGRSNRCTRKACTSHFLSCNTSRCGETTCTSHYLSCNTSRCDETACTSYFPCCQTSRCGETACSWNQSHQANDDADRCLSGYVSGFPG